MFSGWWARNCGGRSCMIGRLSKLLKRPFQTKKQPIFLLSHESEGDRWFTPKVEVSLCGHATLASAHVLWQEGVGGPDETIPFHTLSGVLTASRKGEEIELDFPLEPDEPIDPPANLGKALGVPLEYVGKNR